MRFMMLMIPDKRAEAGVLPALEDLAAMGRYNEELANAGVLKALDGLHPTSKGARVSFPGGKPTVTDGPFPESKEVVGGYWMIDVASKAEAVAWAKRCPISDDSTIEIRQVYEIADFPADRIPPEFAELERKLQSKL